MDIKSLIDKQPRQTWVAFGDAGLEFQVRFVDKGTLSRWATECQTWAFDQKLKQRLPRLDSAALLRKFCQGAVLDWRNVTPRTVSTILPVKPEVAAGKEDEVIPFSQESLVLLLESCYDLDQFLQNSVTDASLFNGMAAVDQEDRAKNS